MKHSSHVARNIVSVFLLAVGLAHATGVVIQANSNFNGTKLTALNVLITVGGLTGGATPLGNQAGTEQWYAPGGVVSGGAINLTTPGNAVLNYPGAGPLAIPVGPDAAGGAINYDFPNNPTNVTGSPKITWRNVTFSWIFSKIVIDPTGQPGGANQSWSIVGSPELSMNDPVLGSRTMDVTGSKFDLSYSNLGNGEYGITVDDSSSYIQLSDGSLITLADGMSLGTLQFTSDSAMQATGTVDLSGLGLAGDFDWNSNSNLTSATVDPDSSFNAPTISMIPEPASLFLIGCGLVGLAAARRRKR